MSHSLPWHAFYHRDSTYRCDPCAKRRAIFSDLGFTNTMMERITGITIVFPRTDLLAYSCSSRRNATANTRGSIALVPAKVENLQFYHWSVNFEVPGSYLVRLNAVFLYSKSATSIDIAFRLLPALSTGMNKRKHKCPFCASAYLQMYRRRLGLDRRPFCA